jgi:hypothetical protein
LEFDDGDAQPFAGLDLRRLPVAVTDRQHDHVGVDPLDEREVAREADPPRGELGPDQLADVDVDAEPIADLVIDPFDTRCVLRRERPTVPEALTQLR